jgi:hypothetical protein
MQFNFTCTIPVTGLFLSEIKYTFRMKFIGKNSWLRKRPHSHNLCSPLKETSELCLGTELKDVLEVSMWRWTGDGR